MSYKHGMSGTPTHNAWRHMKQRCNNLNDADYNNYGGRGIRICETWLEFESFFADMGKCPVGLTLERVNNDKGYNPDNCKWATYTEQNKNTRTRVDNKLGITGVWWDKRRKKFAATICTNHKRKWLGYFNNIAEAIIARQREEYKYARTIS